MAAKLRTVRWQKVRELPTKGTKGEQSAYWKWAFQHNKMNEDGEVAESQLANPDHVCEPEPAPENKNRIIMRKVLQQAKLSKMEKKVLEQLGLKGATEEETAEKLGISRRSVRTLLARAQAKCKKIYVAKTRNQDDIDEQEAVE